MSTALKRISHAQTTNQLHHRTAPLRSSRAAQTGNANGLKQSFRGCEKELASLGDILDLARACNINVTEHQRKPEDKLTNLLADLLELQTQLYQLRRIHGISSDNFTTFKLIRPSSINENSTSLLELTNHLRGLLSSRRQLLMRLRQRHAEDILLIEPEFHRIVTELFPRIIKSISEVSKDFERVDYHLENSINTHELDGTIQQMSSTIATYSNYSDALEELRILMEEIQYVGSS